MQKEDAEYDVTLYSDNFYLDRMGEYMQLQKIMRYALSLNKPAEERPQQPIIIITMTSLFLVLIKKERWIGMHIYLSGKPL